MYIYLYNLLYSPTIIEDVCISYGYVILLKLLNQCTKQHHQSIFTCLAEKWQYIWSSLSQRMLIVMSIRLNPIIISNKCSSLVPYRKRKCTNDGSYDLDDLLFSRCPFNAFKLDNKCFFFNIASRTEKKSGHRLALFRFASVALVYQN